MKDSATYTGLVAPPRRGLATEAEALVLGLHVAGIRGLASLVPRAVEGRPRTVRGLAPKGGDGRQVAQAANLRVFGVCGRLLAGVTNSLGLLVSRSSQGPRARFRRICRAPMSVRLLLQEPSEILLDPVRRPAGALRGHWGDAVARLRPQARAAARVAVSVPSSAGKAPKAER